MNTNHQKSFLGVKNAGFGLIGLLVVVLIVGILAAVALPPHQIAVDKARLTRVIPRVKTLKDSVEVYWMAHGRYEEDAAGLSPDEFPGCMVGGAGPVHGDDSWFNVLTNASFLY